MASSWLSFGKTPWPISTPRMPLPYISSSWATSTALSAVIGTFHRTQGMSWSGGAANVSAVRSVTGFIDQRSGATAELVPLGSAVAGADTPAPSRPAAAMDSARDGATRRRQEVVEVMCFLLKRSPREGGTGIKE